VKAGSPAAVLAAPAGDAQAVDVPSLIVTIAALAASYRTLGTAVGDLVARELSALAAELRSGGAR
jgi:hypothetical protein